MKRWSKEEIEKLKEFVDTHFNIELAEMFGVTRKSIERILSRNNIRRSLPNSFRWEAHNKTEIKYKLAYFNTVLGDFHICISHKPSSVGYPRTYRDGKYQSIPRYIYERQHGCIPKGLVIRHKCDNKMCINPNHLEIGTHCDNMNDITERGLRLCGEDITQAKLNKTQVLQIKKELCNYKRGDNTKIAKKYGVSITCITDIKAGRTWKHLTVKEI